MPIIDKHIAFDSIFNRYYAGLCVYCESFIGDPSFSEDLVQDVFVNIWMKRNELDFDETIGSYLYKSAHNACIHYLRRQQVENRYSIQVKAKLFEAECIPFEWFVVDTDPAEKTEIQALYRQALDQLPAQTREIFLFSREKGMKYSEIVESTGLSIKAIEYHISKALKVFRTVLKDYLQSC